MSKENERDHILSEIEGWEHNCKQLQTQVTNLEQACKLSKAAVEAMQSANDKLSGEVARLQKENEGLRLLCVALNREATGFINTSFIDEQWAYLITPNTQGRENETN